MVSLSQYSFGLFCVILLMTPFNLIPSAEARRINRGETKSVPNSQSDLQILTNVLQLILSKFGIQNLNVGAALQKVTQASQTGLSATNGLDVFDNGLVQLFQYGILIPVADEVKANIVNQLVTLLGSSFAKLELQAASNGLVQVFTKFSKNEMSAKGTISTIKAHILSYQNAVFVKWDVQKYLNLKTINTVSANAEKYTTSVQSILGSALKVPQCLTEAVSLG